MSLSPTGRATLATVSFASIAAAGWLLTSFTVQSAPLLLYYAVLVLNTFFSVRAFSAITPPDNVQSLFDGALVLVYVALAFSFGSVVQFALVSALLFVLAIAKYLHLRRLVGSALLLPRKIRINALGVLLSLGALVIALAGYPHLAAWTLALVFSAANVYLLGINPMYDLHR